MLPSIEGVRKYILDGDVDIAVVEWSVVTEYDSVLSRGILDKL